MSEVSERVVWEPPYIRLLETGELARRVSALEALLESCTVCPRDCLNNRLQNEIAACYSGRLPIVSSYTAHFGEEPALVGTRGAAVAATVGRPPVSLAFRAAFWSPHCFLKSGSWYSFASPLSDF